MEDDKVMDGASKNSSALYQTKRVNTSRVMT